MEKRNVKLTTTITIEDAEMLLGAIYGVYNRGRHFVGLDKDCVNVQLWHEVLKDFTYKQVFTAVVRYMKANSRAPLPCDIFRGCLDVFSEEEELRQIDDKIRGMTQEEFRQAFCEARRPTA